MFEFEPLTLSDLPFLLEIRNECKDSLHDNRSFTLPDCESWFRAARPDFHLIRYNGERIGYFRISNYEPQNASIYVGADLHKAFRGQGLARQAYEAFLPLIKERYHVTTVSLEVLSHNAVAHHLYQKLGFVEVDRKEHIAIRNSKPVDSIVMTKKL